MGKKSVTIYDIAKEAGVSASMVSRVVSGKGSVSEGNRVRIQQILKENNFKPNAVARGLQQQRSKMIGFLLPHIANQYFSSVYYEFEKWASEQGFMTILFNGKNDWNMELKLLHIMEESRVEAIVIMGGNADAIEIPKEYYEEVTRINQTIPCVICGEQAARFDCVGVHPDSQSAGELVKHLYSLGVKSLGIFGGAESRYPSVLKKNKFIKTAQEYNITMCQEWILGNSYDVADGAQAMKELLKEKKLPKAVCCINDHVAAGAINTAIAAGLRIPEDIAFTGYDGVEIASIIHPSITTMQYDYEQYGSKIFSAVEKLIQGNPCPKMTLIDSKMIIGESTQRKKEYIEDKNGQEYLYTNSHIL